MIQAILVTSAPIFTIFTSFFAVPRYSTCLVFKRLCYMLGRKSCYNKSYFYTLCILHLTDKKNNFQDISNKWSQTDIIDRRIVDKPVYCFLDYIVYNLEQRHFIYNYTVHQTIHLQSKTHKIDCLNVLNSNSDCCSVQNNLYHTNQLYNLTVTVLWSQMLHESQFSLHLWAHSPIISSRTHIAATIPNITGPVFPTIETTI